MQAARVARCAATASPRCGVVVELDDEGLPQSIRGDRDHPVSKGFICVRGQAAIDYFNHPRRLNNPLQRSGRRGSGSFIEVSWDEALDDIGERLLRIAETDGPESVALLQGRQFASDSKFGGRLMHKFGSPNVGGVGLYVRRATVRRRRAHVRFRIGLPWTWSPGTTNVVVLWGQHPSASSPPYWGSCGTRCARARSSSSSTHDPPSRRRQQISGSSHGRRPTQR